MVESWVVGTLMLVISYGGTLAGCLLQGILPKTQLAEETRDIVKLVVGLIGTMGALVLGLLIGSARNNHEHQRQEIIELGSKIVALDRTMALYGAETKPMRDDFRTLVAAAIERMWPIDRSVPGRTDPSRLAEDWYHRLQKLHPVDEDQRFYHARAVGLATDLLNGRWLLYQQATGTISPPFAGMMVFWFGFIFACIGILAPRNPTVLVTLFLCAVSVSAAMVLASELDQPFAGFMRMSSEPMRKALTQLGLP
jgi:hypothetical protein